MDEKEIKKNVQKTIKWLATEHKFFLELKDDLKELKEDIAKSKEKDAVKDVKHALRNFKYIGRAERRFDTYEQEMLVELENSFQLSGTVKEVEELIKRIRAEAANLIKDASYYEGHLKDMLIHLKEEIAEHEIEQAQAILIEIEQTIDDAEKWIAALSVDLDNAKKLVSNKTKLKYRRLKEIKKILVEAKAKEDYANPTSSEWRNIVNGAIHQTKLEKDGHLERQSYPYNSGRWENDFKWRIIQRVDEFMEAVDLYEKGEDYTNALRVCSKALDMVNKYDEIKGSKNEHRHALIEKKMSEIKAKM